MTTQRNKVLALLKQAGLRGVNSYTFTYSYQVKQAPTRIKELKDLGHTIISRTEKNRSVTYILQNSPALKRIIEPSIEPLPWEDTLIPVKKGEYTFWEKPTKPKQLGMF